MADLTDDDIMYLLKAIKSGKPDLPDRQDGGVDPADLEAARTGSTPLRDIQFGAGDGSIHGSAQPASKSTPASDPETPAPQKTAAPSKEYKTNEAAPDSNEELQGLLSRLEEGQRNDRSQAYSDRAAAYGRLAGGAMSTQMGHLPEVHVDIPAIPSEAGNIKDIMGATDKMRTGASVRRQNEVENRNINDKSSQAEFVLGDEKSERDPNSPASDLYRKIAKAMLVQNGSDPELVSDMHSAHDLKLAMPGLTQIVKKTIANDTVAETEKKTLRHENRSDARTHELVRAGLAGKVLGAGETAAGNAGKNAFDQSKFDIPSLIREGPVDSTQYRKVDDAMTSAESAKVTARKLLKILSDNSHPLPGTDEFIRLKSDAMNLASDLNKAQFGGVMRKWDKDWIDQQIQQPTDLYNWFQNGGKVGLEETVNNLDSHMDKLLKHNKYHVAGHGETQDKWNAAHPEANSGPSGGGSHGGPYQDPNVLGELEKHVIGGGPVPQLRGGRPSPMAQPAQAPQGQPESAADRIRRRQQELAGQ